MVLQMARQQRAQLFGSLDLISAIAMENQPERLCCNKTLCVNVRCALQADISQHCFNQEPRDNTMAAAFSDGTAPMLL